MLFIYILQQVSFILICCIYIVMIRTISILKNLVFILANEVVNNPAVNSEWFILQVYKALMAICVLQSFVLGTLLTEMAYSSEILQQIGEHIQGHPDAPLPEITFNNSFTNGYCGNNYMSGVYFQMYMLLILYIFFCMIKVIRNLCEPNVEPREFMGLIAILMVYSVFLWYLVFNTVYNCVFGKQRLLDVLRTQNHKPVWEVFLAAFQQAWNDTLQTGIEYEF